MIYLDNSASSWPKPEKVYQAVDECLREGGNPGRGVNQSSLNMSRVVFEARCEIADFFNINNEKQLVFTKNITEALNQVLKSFLDSGDHVLVSPVEHNAVMRPLEYLKESKGIKYDIIPGDSMGNINLEDIEKLINKKTKLIVINHASNVLGTILPVEQITKIAKRYNIHTMLDAAQTAGVIPIDIKELNVDFFTFTGHKGLLGPQGTGGLYVKENISLEPLIHGGTGTNSKIMRQTGSFPDDFESGTVNVPGIAGLLEGVRYCKNNLNSIGKHEKKLMEKLMDYLQKKPEIEITGPQNSSQRVGLVTFNINDLDSDMVGQMLDDNYQISVRTGLHCSPLAHEIAGTIELGGVRVSVGPFNKEEHIDQLIKALDEIIAENHC